jgi:hypothetical protein
VHPSINTNRKIASVYTEGITKGVTVRFKKTNRSLT